ncbi:C2 domain-containing protein [Polychytrium aggregatum]|uniref:C2 domain-containing protein n=1 Tax=Polychytrium aggregatum TaxID=110093 RepID=UPI0022FE81E0|nr:C2 domain-containing protein [Polychytrium aggregatum]KAI9193717.1 C2 domain-containing protein [Polychytrium aggregatum]
MAGILKVTVLEAKNLKSEDLLGKNDPYVVLWVDPNHKQKTSVKNQAGAHATWNEQFSFAVNQDDHKTLHLTVLDQDLIHDDKIGSGSFSFSQLGPQPVDVWVPLPAHLFFSHGEVRLSVSYHKA